MVRLGLDGGAIAWGCRRTLCCLPPAPPPTCSLTLLLFILALVSASPRRHGWPQVVSGLGGGQISKVTPPKVPPNQPTIPPFPFILLRFYPGWMPVLTLFSMLAYQLNAFLAFSLPLPSHHPFPSFLVVGTHRSLLTPGPLVTINNLQSTTLVIKNKQRFTLP